MEWPIFLYQKEKKKKTESAKNLYIVLRSLKMPEAEAGEMAQ